ncbi:MAG: cyclic nucleotide-binding domain-containing protein [Desulfobacteraceae bacterium]|nr:cyclic nucleotide-binding domain-containing protein [Desulfobacteraceae bacterium]
MPKTVKDNKEHLLLCPVFREVPPDKLDEIARSVGNRTVPPKALVFREGDAADRFYIVCSGKVRVFVNHGDEVERELSVLGAGESFGEMGLLTGEARTASVEALSEAHLIYLTKEQFDQLLEDCPAVSRKFMKDMRKWLVKDQEIIGEEAGAVMSASRLSWIDFAMVLGISILLALSFNHANPNGIPLFPAAPDRTVFGKVSATEAMQKQKEGKALIVDAMPSNFYQKRHIKGAVNMPMALFDIVFLMNFSEEDKEREVLVYGNSISRPYDVEIANKLQLRGYSDVKMIDGGLKAWEAVGYPVEEAASK